MYKEGISSQDRTERKVLAELLASEKARPLLEILTRLKSAGEKEQKKERWSGNKEMIGRGRNCLRSKSEKARPRRG